MENLIDFIQEKKFSDFKEMTNKVIKQKIREHSELQSYFDEINKLKENTRVNMKVIGEK